MDLEEFTSELRGDRKSLATVRSYQGALRQFLDFVSDPRYEWSTVCDRLFATHPIQICFEWNTVAHVADYEGRPARRSLTRVELQRLFDHADEQVAAARTAGRKGWLAALRDSAALKVAYAWGLRRRELVMLELADIGSNPKAPEFGTYGVLYIRWGKASRGGAPSSPQRADGLPLVGAGAAAVGHRVSGPVRPCPSDRMVVAHRTVQPPQRGRTERAVQPLP